MVQVHTRVGKGRGEGHLTGATAIALSQVLLRRICGHAKTSLTLSGSVVASSVLVVFYSPRKRRWIDAGRAAWGTTAEGRSPSGTTCLDFRGVSIYSGAQTTSKGVEGADGRTGGRADGRTGGRADGQVLALASSSKTKKQRNKGFSAPDEDKSRAEAVEAATTRKSWATCARRGRRPPITRPKTRTLRTGAPGTSSSGNSCSVYQRSPRCTRGCGRTVKFGTRTRLARRT